MYRTIKRFFDFVLSFLALLFLTPVLLIAFVGIKLSSPGPAIFKANRIGQNGYLFTMYKFRTMHLNNEKGHIITLRTDNRIFPFGKFLRKSKIDELPQLINILRGEMSIVGWRPEDQENAEKVFQGRFQKILNAKPGLTSPGSLYDYTHGELYENEDQYETEFIPQKMELELFYTEHRSLSYDINLIIRTICTIFGVVLGKKEFKKPHEIELIKTEEHKNASVL